MSMPASVVNLALPMQVSGGDEATAMFALAQWLLPRVPSIGEEVLVEAIGHRMKIEGVRWDITGKATVVLQEARVRPEALDALERDGWEVAPWDDEPPSDWLA